MGSADSRDASPNAKQIVFLFMAAIFVAVLVFLTGVFVGRGVPLVGGFSVSGPSSNRQSTSELAPAALSRPRSEPSAAASESGQLTYYRRLDESEQLPEAFRSSDTDTIVSKTVEETENLNKSGTLSLESDGSGTEHTSLLSGNSAVRSPPLIEGFSVQVTAVRSQVSARRVAGQLAEKGYPASVLDPNFDEPIAVYRVRVGPYAERAEAERIMRRLEAEEQLKPFITW